MPQDSWTGYPLEELRVKGGSEGGLGEGAPLAENLSVAARTALL